MKSSFLPVYMMMAASLLMGCRPDNTPDNPGGGQEPDVPGAEVTAKTPGADFFYKGTTMCFASYMQGFGLKYRENGAEKDPYASVAGHGGNCVRLQLDQVQFSKYDGVSIDWQTMGRVLADARKAKAQGLEIFLTLKPDYDEFDDSKTYHNICPPAWSGQAEPEMGQSLYDWVYASLEALAAEGIYPAVVAVGNEVNVGFCRASRNAGADNSRTGRLLCYGLRAVRDYAAKYNPACLSAIHIANPAKAQASIKAYEDAGATDYDVVALSYYPGSDIGHSLPVNSFTAFAKLFARKIMVVETAYSFTTGTKDGKWMGDWCNNAYNYPNWNDAQNATNYTPAMQRAWLKALAEDVKGGGGIGLITWGTESLPDLLTGKADGHGTGLYTYPAAWAYGSTWENNSYWDFTNDNNLHEGIDWMKDIL